MRTVSTTPPRGTGVGIHFWFLVPSPLEVPLVRWCVWHRDEAPNRDPQSQGALWGSALLPSWLLLSPQGPRADTEHPHPQAHLGGNSRNKPGCALVIPYQGWWWWW